MRTKPFTIENIEDPDIMPVSSGSTLFVILCYEFWITPNLQYCARLHSKMEKSASEIRSERVNKHITRYKTVSDSAIVYWFLITCVSGRTNLDPIKHVIYSDLTHTFFFCHGDLNLVLKKFFSMVVRMYFYCEDLL